VYDDGNDDDDGDGDDDDDDDDDDDTTGSPQPRIAGCQAASSAGSTPVSCRPSLRTPSRASGTRRAPGARRRTADRVHSTRLTLLTVKRWCVVNKKGSLFHLPDEIIDKLRAAYFTQLEESELSDALKNELRTEAKFLSVLQHLQAGRKCYYICRDDEHLCVNNKAQPVPR
jgi:hypothetical protein